MFLRFLEIVTDWISWGTLKELIKELLGKSLETSSGSLEVVPRVKIEKIQMQSLKEYIEEFLKESLDYV